MTAPDAAGDTAGAPDDGPGDAERGELRSGADGGRRRSDAAADDRARRNFGFTWGETDGMRWLRNGDGDYKRVAPEFFPVLRGLARGERDPADVDPEALRAVDLLLDEGYLRPDGDVTKLEQRADGRVWIRFAAFALGTVLLAALVALRWGDLWRLPGSVPEAVLAVAFFVGATAVHEAGHLSASRPYFEPEIRFRRLNGVIPAVITRTNDAWQCPRAVRLWISLAGPFVDVAIALALAVAYFLFPQRDALGLLLSVQLVRIALVLNPLMEGDGYWLLADALGAHNLRSRAFRDLRRARPTAAAAFGVAVVAFTAAFVAAGVALLAIVVGVR